MMVYEVIQHGIDGIIYSRLYSTREKAIKEYEKIEKQLSQEYDEAPDTYKEHYSKEEFLLNELEYWEITEREVK